MKVNVKWNKESYSNLELILEEPVEVFKAQLYSLTGVDPSRQKLLTKGRFLKDDSDLIKLNIQEGQMITMMGTVGELSKGPAKPVVFLEDMTDAQITEALELPVGLANLGNTCYMNASLQVLRTIPELYKSLQNYDKKPTESDPQSGLVTSLKDLVVQLQKSGESYPPFVFLQYLRLAFPKFSQQETRGVYSQQDAEECFSSIVTTLHQKLKADDNSSSFVEKYFGGQFITTMSAPEAEGEEPTISQEPFFKLDCHISKEINHLTSGLDESFKTEIDKNSPTLNKTVKYVKEFKIDRLPNYLPINFVRFFWKPTERIKAKILKKVKFPLEIDMFSYCTKELQDKLSPARTKIEELDELDRNKKIKLQSEGTPSSPRASSQDQIYSAADSSLKSDEGANITGHYQLQAVLTHTGRTADSGHYIAWARKDANQWYKFDDDKVDLVDDNAIKALDGGGDWHTAYILLYGPKQF